MTRDEIAETCWQFCEQQFGIKRDGRFTEDSDFHADFYADPLDHLQFLEFVAEQFEVEVTDEEMDYVLTFRDLVNLIESKT